MALRKKKKMKEDCDAEMNAKQIAETQKLVADIGNRKSDGLIFILEKTKISMEGVIFIHNMNRYEIMKQIIQKLDLDPSDVLKITLMAAVESD